MPVTPTYPGVYVEEIPSGVRTITGVATSITAFIGTATRGPTTYPVRIQSFADFERKFGGLVPSSHLGYSVRQFFLNGGSDAFIIRVVHVDKDNPQDPEESAVAATVEHDGLKLIAASEGEWGKKLKIVARNDEVRKVRTDQGEKGPLFNLFIKDETTKQVETFRNLSCNPLDPTYAISVLRDQSELVRPIEVDPAKAPNHDPPAEDENPDPFKVSGKHTPFSDDGSDGPPISSNDIIGSVVEGDGAVVKRGIKLLEDIDLFNLLYIPPLSREGGDVPLAEAAKACDDRRAMLIIDPRSGWKNVAKAEQGIQSDLSDLGDFRKNAAVFFPRIRVADPLKENRLEEFAPGGAVAGMFARTDTNRGVWKAPAGQNDGRLAGVSELSMTLTDGDNGRLNPLGLNCLRTFPIFGNVVWGARTADGADQAASEWKYIPVRRTALFIEESLRRGLGWVVMEPNDEALWAQIRLNVGAFMQNLFTQGAFQGQSPAEAYFVKCDADTTTQIHIDLGIVNIHVGFAPLKPAEFVIIKLQQIAGQLQT